MMSLLALTNTKIMQGVWQGIVTGSDVRPAIEVTHNDTLLEGVTLEHDPDQDHWRLHFPIPPQAIADGVQTLLMTDKVTGEKVGQCTLIAGEALGDDIRAEMDLLRAELDMLKRAFRRHCLETG
jgi:hypothetical protein